MGGVRTKLWALGRVGQVLAARASERFGSPARQTDPPASPREIDAGWLTAILCAGTPGARVTAVNRHGQSAGTTTRESLELTYNAAGSAARLPTRLLVKCTTTAAQRLMLGLGGLIDGEPGFYRAVRPLLEIEAPIGYYGAVDRRTWRSAVVIEDVIATRGASFWDPTTGLGRAQLEDVLSTMAAWHGALWESEHLSRWGWLKTPAEQMRVIDELIGIADRTTAGFDRARAVIPAALRGRQQDLFEGMRRSMRLASRRPHTYLHGDLHVANTYLTSAGRVGVADWQVALRGCWAHDFGYLLATALDVDTRRARERELLSFYLERLASAGGPALSSDAAWLAYRRSTLYPYFAWVYTIGRSRLQPRFAPEELSLTMIGRIAAAIEDLDSLGAVGL
jgi:hypothetical protein